MFGQTELNASFQEAPHQDRRENQHRRGKTFSRQRYPYHNISREVGKERPNRWNKQLYSNKDGYEKRRNSSEPIPCKYWGN